MWRIINGERWSYVFFFAAGGERGVYICYGVVTTEGKEVYVYMFRKTVLLAHLSEKTPLLTSFSATTTTTTLLHVVRLLYTQRRAIMTTSTPTIQHLQIPVVDSSGGGGGGSTQKPSTVSAYLHLPASAPTAHAPSSSSSQSTNSGAAAILLSGAGGGVLGPSGMYVSLAARLASAGGITTVRQDFRRPARTRSCVADVRACMAYLSARHGIRRVVLIGWSFGGAPVFTVAGGGSNSRPDDDGAVVVVVGCATIASQTAETDGIRRLSPATPVLLLHGTADTTLPPDCSTRLYHAYGDDKDGSRELRLFEGDDHALSRNADEAETLLADFVRRCLLLDDEDDAGRDDDGTARLVVAAPRGSRVLMLPANAAAGAGWVPLGVS